MRRTTVILACVVLVGVVATRFAADFAVGEIVRRVFTAGTGSEVELSDTRVTFFPFGATGRGVSVKHPSEDVDGGFTAERIAIQLELLPLLSKQVILHLTLEGTRLHSLGEPTGFLRTIQFLFPEKPEHEVPRPPAWHDFLTRDWRVWMPTLRIVTPPGAQVPLRVGSQDLQATAEVVTVTGTDPTGLPQDPFEMTVVAEGVSLVWKQEGAWHAREFGAASGRALFVSGKIGLEDIQVTPHSREGSNNSIRAEGMMRVRGEGIYDIRYQASLFDEALHALVFGQADGADTISGAAHINGTLEGTLHAPVADAHVSLDLERIPFAPLRSECLPRRFEGRLHAEPDHLALGTIVVDDILTDGRVRYDLATKAIGGAFELDMSPEKNFVERCLLKGSEGAQDAWAVALRDAVADSRTTVEFSGLSEPVRGELRASSEFFLEDPSSRSVLELDANYADDLLNVRLKERGVHPQIQELAPATTTSASAQTSFSTAVNSIIEASLEYSVAEARLRVPKLEVVRYPTRRLLARLVPLLPEAIYPILLETFAAGSLTSLSASVPTARRVTELEGRARLQVTGIRPDLIGESTLTIPVEAKAGAVNLVGASLESSAGTLAASARIAPDGSVQGTATLDRFALDALPTLRPNPAAAGALLTATAGIDGTVREPRYSGTLELTTPELLSGEPSSTANFSGTSERVEVTASLLGGQAHLQATYPFTDDVPLAVEASTERLPIGWLLQDASDETAIERTATSGVEQAADITARLSYRGKRTEPLLGEGSLRVERLSLSAPGLSFTHDAPLVATVHQGRLRFENVKFELQGQPVELQGYVDRQTGWHAGFHGTVLLGPYLSRLPNIEQMTGAVNVQLAVKGRWNEPALDGTLTLVRGSLTLPLGDTVVGVEQIDAVARFVDGDLLLDKATARMGGGPVEARASVLHAVSASKRQIDATLAFQNVLLEPTANSVVQLDGTLRAKQDVGQPLSVQGEISIDNALYEQSINLAEIVASLTARLLRGTAAVDSTTRTSNKSVEHSPIELDVRVIGDNGLLIDTDFAQAELQAELHVVGSASDIRVGGAVEVISGSFGLQSSRFDIVSGTLNFAERETRLDPKIDLIGESTVRTIAGDEQLVRILVTGRLSDPKVSFSSDGGLAEQEIIALLTGGNTVGGLSIIEQKERDYSFRELISPNSELGIRDRLAGLTGFSEVQVQTDLSRSTGEFVPALVASRPLVQDVDLNVKYELAGEQVSELGAKYPLTPYLDLVSAWKSRPVTTSVNDSSGSYEVGVRYRKSFSGFVFWAPNPEKRSD
ncbi:MAG: translocation/assembly module TamB domain-containing protein [Bdellovibrionales bacterium]|nr:translocation/assembly module TamB domain-containing protein [Bdellovibrionales bacterium]